MRKIYKIIGQDFSDIHNTGVLLRLKNLCSGEITFKTPIELFNDKLFLKKLTTSDILRVGYMVGEYQMYLSYRFIADKKKITLH